MYLSVSADSGSVLVYDAPVTSSSTPVATLPETWPEEIFVDPAGRLFVPVTGGGNEGTVQVYDSPVTSSSSAAFTLTTGGSGNYPEDVTEDSSGNVYVSIPYSNICCLAEFTAAAIGSGQSVSSPSVLVPGNASTFNDPYGIALDANGHLFAADQYGDDLLQFSLPLSDASSPNAAVASSDDNGDNLYGIAVDSSNRVYVPNLIACGIVYVFDQPITDASTPAFTIPIYPTAGCGTQHSVIAMAFDGSGNLWLTTFQDDVWEVRAPITASSTPKRVLSGLPSGLWGIAFGP